MSEWQNFKLREVGTLQRGRSRHRPRYAFHLFNGPYPFIQTGEVREARKYVSTFENTYSEAGLAQSKLWPKGTLCITIAANIAELAILGFDACFPDSVLGFIPDETRSDLDFVYYTLTHFQKQLKHIGEGSVQDNINLGTFEDIEFPFPSLPEQKAIASVLSSLDDKIDLLHRQNRTLEAMAETLFRQWFIEEAKEDWEVSPLGDVVKIAYGKNLPTSRLLDSGYPVFGGNGQIGFYDRFLYSEPQVLVSCRGEASGKVNISLPNSFITNNSLVLERKENGISFEYLKFYALVYDFGLHVSGSAQPQITIDGLFNAEFRWPPLDLVESFTEVVRPLEDKRLTNYIQIQTLENLRDTLLPKLMSGEVRVQYQTEEVA